MLPSSLDFDTTKLDMITTFAKDEGLKLSPIALYKFRPLYTDLNTFYPDEISVKIRLAWSLIKCGIEYKDGMFWYTNGSATIVANLPTMLDIILSPITAPKEA